MIRAAVRPELPSGTITFLFTDVEGSTKLLHELGAERYAEALAEHRRVIRDACAREGGVEVDTQGDAFFFAFPTAPGALAAAAGFTDRLATGRIQVRAGLHTGTPLLTDEGYVGDDVHFGARVAATSHGGQVVLSRATAAIVEAELLDLGEHRLKDISEPVPIYQLGVGSFPPLKTMSNTNLPRPASSFLGRESELQEVLARIEAGARLLTLTGPGGTGKTRLALEAAATLVPSYKAGVFWVGLASLRDPALVTETIAQTLGAKDGLAEHVGERELLLLLDNLEQVIEAAPDLSELLQACPNLAFLVTSRELLHVSGEVEYPVPPLAESEAVSLFCERSQLEPSDEIAELCARLDSLPLAVELAAARTKALTPTQIVKRLSQRLDLFKGGRDADPRQQTLRATIEWSYELLTPAEQQLFARISVFAGGCTLEAAEEVADADLDTLQSLVEKSLVRFTATDTGSRYWMLETIREYAGERLEAVETHRRYLDHFVGVVTPFAGAHDSLTADADVMERLDVETANMRAVLRLLLDQPNGERALEVVGTLAAYWLARGQFHEGLMWVEGALVLDGARENAARGRALSAAADLSWALGDLGRARAHATESLSFAESHGEPRAIAQALHDLAEVVTEEGDLERAKTLYGEAIRRAHEVDYPAPGSHINLGEIAFLERDYERSRELTLLALAVFRERNNQLGSATGLLNLACVDLYSGKVDEARSSLRESIEICVALRYDALSTACVQACAGLLAHTKRPREAASLLGAGERLLEEMGSRPEATQRQMNEETRALIRAGLDDREMAVAWQAGREMALEQALSFALTRLD
jgi:predicted ATPase/class 3 adenylate cyclase